MSKQDSNPTPLQEHEIYEGVISSIEDYGILVLLPENEMGVLHYIDIALGNISKRELGTLSKGDIVTVQVTRIQADLGRISLVPYPNKFSRIQEFASQYREGDVTTGTYMGVENEAAIVELEFGAIGTIRYCSNNLKISAKDLKKLIPGVNVKVLIASIDVLSDQIILCLLPNDGNDSDYDSILNTPPDKSPETGDSV